jgi:hypothetical protein
MMKTPSLRSGVELWTEVSIIIATPAFTVIGARAVPASPRETHCGPAAIDLIGRTLQDPTQRLALATQENGVSTGSSVPPSGVAGRLPPAGDQSPQGWAIGRFSLPSGSGTSRRISGTGRQNGTRGLR